MYSKYLTFTFFLASFFSVGSFASLPDDYVQRHSDAVESRMIPLVEQRFSELNNRTPSTGSVHFTRGFVSISPEGLIWTSLKNKQTLLVANSDLDDGFRVSGFSISPDANKIAFNTTYHGQDLKHWNVVTVDENPSILMSQPALNRMADFRWSHDSQGFYYSFYNSKEDAKSGKKPIAENRFREIYTEEDRLVFDHGLAQNFGVIDLEDGKTLVAFRVLNPTSGIKTTFSMYKGTLRQDGAYQWRNAYPRNQFIGRFLGLHNNRAILLSGEAGNNLGIVEVDILNNSRKILVPAKDEQVLHTADLAGGKLILQYHSIPEQNVSVSILDLNAKISKTFQIGTDFGLMPFGKLGNFNLGPNGYIARTVFSDVLLGNVAFEINLDTFDLKRLKNETDLNFDGSKVNHQLVSIPATDGTDLSGRLYSVKGEKPKFVYIRYYGWISIKNTPEPREVQMILEAGGAYLTLDLPGGGERGQNWFIEGSRNRHKSFGYISEASSYLQKRLHLTSDQVVAMGRSWGGLTSVNLAAKYGHNFGMINPIVPVIDMEDMFANGWFGRIAHSDFAPLIDENGHYILDQKFFDYVYSLSPVNVVSEIPVGVKINLFTNGLDDRVDQGGEQEARFAKSIEDRVGSENFMYHRSVKGNHGNRYYQALMVSLIVGHYQTNYTPLVKSDSLANK